MDIAEFSAAKRLLVEMYGKMLVHWLRGKLLSLYFRSSKVISDFTQFFSFSKRLVYRFPLSFPFARRSLTFGLQLLHSSFPSLAFHSCLGFDSAIHQTPSIVNFQVIRFVSLSTSSPRFIDIGRFNFLENYEINPAISGSFSRDTCYSKARFCGIEAGFITAIPAACCVIRADLTAAPVAEIYHRHV